MKSENRKPGEIPEGVILGNKVVRLPYTSLLLERFINNKPRSLNESYTWIGRDENLFEFIIETPKSQNKLVSLFSEKQENKIYIPSPVNGLLLHNGHSYGKLNSFGSVTSLLVPDDEWGANDGRSIFSELCDFIWSHRRSLYKDVDDEYLKNEIEDQYSQKCVYDEAMPNYEDYFNAARTKYPKLRPRLKHLSQPNNGG